MSIFPTTSVSATGANITFFCYVDDTERTEWIVNGMSLDDLNEPSIVPEFFPMARISSLTFIHVPLSYNSTTVQCLEHQASGTPDYSETAELLVQGWWGANYVVDVAVQSCMLSLPYMCV